MKFNKSICFWRMALLAFPLVLVACGSNSNSSSPSTPTPVAGVSPTPTPSPDNQITCSAPALAAGEKVYYTGATGNSTFPDTTLSYTGIVQAIFSNGTAQVQWTQPTQPNPNVQVWSVLMTEGKCTPDITGKTVLYTGSQGTSTPNFPDPNAVYTGVLVTVYAGGFAEVKWTHLSHDTVESFKNLALSE